MSLKDLFTWFQSPQRGLFISYLSSNPPSPPAEYNCFSPLSGDCLFLTKV